jgi:hypothetical protein
MFGKALKMACIEVLQIGIWNVLDSVIANQYLLAIP